jgi:hypothetical protein
MRRGARDPPSGSGDGRLMHRFDPEAVILGGCVADAAAIC